MGEYVIKLFNLFVGGWAKRNFLRLKGHFIRRGTRLMVQLEWKMGLLFRGQGVLESLIRRLMEAKPVENKSFLKLGQKNKSILTSTLIFTQGLISSKNSLTLTLSKINPNLNLRKRMVKNLCLIHYCWVKAWSVKSNRIYKGLW